MRLFTSKDVLEPKMQEFDSGVGRTAKVLRVKYVVLSKRSVLSISISDNPINLI
jgi:hypothetical protein